MDGRSEAGSGASSESASRRVSVGGQERLTSVRGVVKKVVRGQRNRTVELAASIPCGAPCRKVGRSSVVVELDLVWQAG